MQQARRNRGLTLPLHHTHTHTHTILTPPPIIPAVVAIKNKLVAKTTHSIQSMTHAKLRSLSSFRYHNFTHFLSLDCQKDAFNR
jgi:pyrimidine deaminase RibD-like protein